MSRRRRAAAGAAVVLVGGGAVASALLLARDEPPTAEAASRATNAVAVERRDLVEISEQDGTLGYSGRRDVLGNLSGTVTWLPSGGRIVQVNHPLYRVDGTPVVLLDGRVPAYRELSPSTSDGADVGQLERNLRRLGYDAGHAMMVDGVWDGGTTAAVKAWQDDHNLKETGTLELGRIVFLPGGSRRIGEVTADLGESTGGAGTGDQGDGGGGGGGATVLTATSTQRVVHVDLATSKQAVARSGARVSVELPSGKIVHGRITAVGRVAVAPDDDSGDPGANTDPTISVSIRLLRQTALRLDKAPVTVRFEESRRRKVLAVPVTALVARPGGELAVRSVGAGGLLGPLLPVETGLYTGGYVEISGPSVRAGLRVADAGATA